MVPDDALTGTGEIEKQQALLQQRISECQTLLENYQSTLTSLEAIRDKAIQASEEAAKAKGEAEAQRDLATQAKAAADAARISAEAERDQAVQAKAPAIEAKVVAETNRDQAAQAKTTAEQERDESVHAKVAAEAARDLAAQAKAAAESERDLASQVRASVEAERDLATQAKTATEAERDLAIQAKTASVGERDLATLAKVAAEGERDSATQAKIAAEKEREKAISAANLAIAEARKAEQAHNLSTTAGLAGAFNEKAIQASGREKVWVGLLLLSLSTAATIGWFRYDDLRILLSTKPDTSALIAEVMLCLLGIGGPVWMAWMATRMISRNFIIAEDYSFKASLAKAYVGFKKEAHGSDPLLEQRLLAAAVTQLDANPVRFASSEHPGSPLQDFFQQPFMQEALKDPTFKGKVIDWFGSHFKTKLIVPGKPE